MSNKNYVGFGLGAIQIGLFLREAVRSGNFSRLTVVEVDEAVIQEIRNAGNILHLNIAGKGGIHIETFGNIEVLHPVGDYETVLRRIRAADEIATAIPSVDLYDRGGVNSIAGLLAEGLDPSRPRVVYAAENHNHAAEILEKLVRERNHAVRDVQFVNTVVGKMSGIVTDHKKILHLGLKPVVDAGARAILVEEFNRIFITRITQPGVTCGFPTFAEKDDLLPFEEAKLFGHNCIHSWIAFMGLEKGYKSMDEAGHDRQLMRDALDTFLGESGVALIRKYRKLRDPLFTTQGWEAYARDLLKRMVNPYLSDALERVVRDPRRKLGPNDRVFGAMKIALQNKVNPRRLAAGARAGIGFFMRQTSGDVLDPKKTDWRKRVTEIWMRPPQNQWERDAIAALGSAPKKTAAQKTKPTKAAARKAPSKPAARKKSQSATRKQKGRKQT